MKKTSKLFVYIFVFALFFLVCLLIFNYDSPIEKALETEAYINLPKEAKDYLREYYDETGVILPTEETKIDNEPYLNPDFINYLTLSSAQKNKAEIVPADIISDYVVSEEQHNVMAGFPDRFDLRNYNGDNYTMPLENQKSLGLCWAFATYSQSESLLLLKNETPYYAGATKFSERQLDYVTSSDGIINYSVLTGRSLGNGGTFTNAAIVLADGLGYQEKSGQWSTYTTDYVKKSMNDVFDSSKPKYELLGAIYAPFLDFDTADENTKKNYLDYMKERIVKYGGSYVETQGPGYGCSAKNTDGSIILDVDSVCTVSNGAHAMHVIGWDDNYEYKYCVSSKKHVAYTDSCSKENTRTGKGAWLLKNSWGTSNSYIYLAYDSYRTYFDLATDLKVNDDDWDYIRNFTKITTDKNDEWYTVNYFSSLDSSAVGQIKEIKLNSSIGNIKYYFYVSSTGKEEDFALVSEVKSDDPGFLTIDLSDKNIEYNSSTKIRIKVSSASSYNVPSYFRSVKAYIKLDGSNEKSITTADVTYKNTGEDDSNSFYTVNIVSDLKNISYGKEIEYKLYNSNKQEINFTIINNIPLLEDKIKPIIYIPDTNPAGTYTLESYYMGKKYGSSKIILTNKNVMEGSGTKTDPYIIKNADQLYKIRNNMSAYYKLGNNINLADDTNSTTGLFYNNGKGWSPIANGNTAFTGTLDGNGYSIYGLYSNNLSNKVALFATIGTGATIKNIGFGYFSLYGSSASILANDINSNANGEINISNIYITSSEVYGSMNASFIANSITATKGVINIDQIFTNSILSNINGSSKQYSAGGIATNISSSLTGEVNINNTEFIGVVEIDNITSPSYGAIASQALGNINISNAVINHHVVLHGVGSTNYLKAIFSNVGSGYSVNISNVVYNSELTNNINTFSSVTTENVDICSIKEMKNYDYNDWDDFSLYWKKSINDRNTIPVLKNVNFSSIEVNNITMGVNDETNIYDSVVFYNDNLKKLDLTYENTKIEIDDVGNVIVKDTGITTVNYISLYDGTEGTFEINVSDSNKFKINYYSNDLNNKLISKNYFIINQNAYAEEIFANVGYKISSWNSEPDGSGNMYVLGETFENLQDGEVLDLYAQWEPIKYYLDFRESYLAASVNTRVIVECAYDSDCVIKSDFMAKPGYKVTLFEGQYPLGELHDGDIIRNITTKEGETFIVYAKNFEMISYKIVFDGNLGTGQMDDLIVGYEENTSLPLNLYTRKGYSFKGWNTKPDGSGTKYPDGSVIYKLLNTEGIIELYAQWEETDYKLTLVDENFSDNNDEITFKITDETISLPELKKSGYKFNGWIVKEDFNNWNTDSYYTGEINITDKIGDVTLYADWDIINYVLDFEPKNEDVYDSIEYNVKSWIIQAEVPDFDNLEFEGWKVVSSDGTWPVGEVITFPKSGNAYIGNAKFEAVYNKNVYKVIYQQSEDNELIKYYSELSTCLPDPQIFKNGYKIKEWNIIDGDGDFEKGNKISSNLSIEGMNGNLVIEPVYETESFSISFNSDGGSTIKNIDYTIEDKITLNIPQKNGYIFNGWKVVESSGSWVKDTIYENTDEITNMYGDVSLKAIWKFNKYTITVKDNGTVTQKEYSFGDKIISILSNGKQGCSFKDWKVISSEGSAVLNKEFSTDISLDGVYGNFTIEAVYNVINYKIDFDPDNGTSIPYISYNISNGSISLPTNIRKDGYTFAGWKFVSSDGNWNDFGLTTNINVNGKYGNMVLKAVWNSIKVEVKNYDVQNGYVYVNPLTNLNDYKTHFKVDTSVIMKVFKNGSEVDSNIGTGYIVKFYSGTKEIASYINIVNGDVNGDSKVSTADYVKVRKHIMKSEIITDAIIFDAADVNNDSKITTSDYVKIRKYIMNGGW